MLSDGTSEQAFSLAQVHTRSAENKIAGMSSTAALPLQKLCQQSPDGIAAFTLQPSDRAAAQRIPLYGLTTKKSFWCNVRSKARRCSSSQKYGTGCPALSIISSAFPGKSDVSNSFMCQLYMNSIFIISIGKTLYNAASSIETVVFLRILPALIFMLSSSQAKSSDISLSNMLY